MKLFKISSSRSSVIKILVTVESFEFSVEVKNLKRFKEIKRFEDLTLRIKKGENLLGVIEAALIIMPVLEQVALKMIRTRATYYEGECEM